MIKKILYSLFVLGTILPSEFYGGDAGAKYVEDPLSDTSSFNKKKLSLDNPLEKTQYGAGVNLNIDTQQSKPKAILKNTNDDTNAKPKINIPLKLQQDHPNENNMESPRDIRDFAKKNLDPPKNKKSLDLKNLDPLKKDDSKSFIDTVSAAINTASASAGKLWTSLGNGNFFGIRQDTKEAFSTQAWPVLMSFGAIIWWALGKTKDVYDWYFNRNLGACAKLIKPLTGKYPSYITSNLMDVCQEIGPGKMAPIITASKVLGGKKAQKTLLNTIKKYAYDTSFWIASKVGNCLMGLMSAPAYLEEYLGTALTLTMVSMTCFVLAELYRRGMNNITMPTGGFYKKALELYKDRQQSSEELIQSKFSDLTNKKKEELCKEIDNYKAYVKDKDTIEQKLETLPKQQKNIEEKKELIVKLLSNPKEITADNIKKKIANDQNRREEYSDVIVAGVLILFTYAYQHYQAVTEQTIDDLIKEIDQKNKNLNALESLYSLIKNNKDKVEEKDAPIIKEIIERIKNELDTSKESIKKEINDLKNKKGSKDKIGKLVHAIVEEKEPKIAKEDYRKIVYISRYDNNAYNEETERRAQKVYKDAKRISEKLIKAIENSQKQLTWFQDALVTLVEGIIKPQYNLICGTLNMTKLYFVGIKNILIPIIWYPYIVIWYTLTGIYKTAAFVCNATINGAGYIKSACSK